MPEPKLWIKEWLSNRLSLFLNNYNEHRTYTNNYLTDTNKGFQARNKKLDAEGSTARRSKLYGEEYFIPEYKPRYLTDMLSNLDTVKEYTPTSYSDPGGEVIKTAYYNNIVPLRKAAGTLFTPELELKLHDRRLELVAKYRAGELSKNLMRDTFSKEWNATIEKNINTPFYQAKEQTGWQGQYFPTSHEIVYTRPTLSNRVHELSHSLYLYPKKGGELNLSEVRWIKPQTTSIKSRLLVREGAPNPLNYGNNSSSYWDSPDEVYSRLMLIRHDANLSPDKLVELNDLDRIRKKVKGNPVLKELFMDRYTDDSLLKMFNEVASNMISPQNNSVIYAKNGVKQYPIAKSGIRINGVKFTNKTHNIPSVTDTNLDMANYSLKLLKRKKKK